MFHSPGGRNQLQINVLCPFDLKYSLYSFGNIKPFAATFSTFSCISILHFVCAFPLCSQKRAPSHLQTYFVGMFYKML
jgi:hypothetical protein